MNYVKLALFLAGFHISRGIGSGALVIAAFCWGGQKRIHSEGGEPMELDDIDDKYGEMSKDWNWN